MILGFKSYKYCYHKLATSSTYETSFCPNIGKTHSAEPLPLFELNYTVDSDCAFKTDLIRAVLSHW